jgi:hypothetical protein
MWSYADRIGKTVSDLTIGTVIVLVHVALAGRTTDRRRSSHPDSLPDGTRVWRSQISP